MTPTKSPHPDPNDAADVERREAAFEARRARRAAAAADAADAPPVADAPPADTESEDLTQ